MPFFVLLQIGCVEQARLVNELEIAEIWDCGKG